MKKEPAEKTERAANKSKQTTYVLKLYIAGVTLKSTQAITNIRQICEEHLKGRCDLEVIDIYQQPVLAKGDQIVAVPTLIKKLPPPLRRFIGNLADSERVLFGLDLKSRRTSEQRE
jgi:circadian clock protein KaiB